jgi:hypothetical protein
VSEAPWAKIWWTWYASRSHLGLSGVALALGAPLMLLGRVAAERHSYAHSDGQSDGQSDGDCDLVWLRDKAGKPITAAQVAGVARFPKADVEVALAELVEADTLVVSADGVYGFPNFWRYQETASAARMRKLRRHTERHSDARSAPHVTTEGRGKREEVREKRGDIREVAAEAAPPGDGSEQVTTQVVAKPRKADEAKGFLRAALKASFRASGDVAPEVSDGVAAKAARRVRELVEAGHAPDIATAAQRLVEAARRSGKAFPWCLLDASPLKGAQPPASRSGRLAQAPGTTASDFDGCEDVEAQIARWVNVGK